MTDIVDSPHRLIASNRVEGTGVYNRAGEKLGTISHFMVDKASGHVDYAVLSFGGLFGLGADQYPLPWKVLSYDTGRGGYVVDLDKAVLEKAPRFRDENQPAWDRAYDEHLYAYYGLAYPIL